MKVSEGEKEDEDASKSMGIEREKTTRSTHGVLDEVIPLDRMKLLEVLEKSNPGVLILLPDDLPERKQDLLRVVRNEDGEGRHGVDWERFRDRGGEGLSEEGDSSFGFGSGREELGLESLVSLRDEERRSSESPLPFVVGLNLVVEELLDVIDREEMFPVHGDDDGVPDLGDEDLREE